MNLPAPDASGEDATLRQIELASRGVELAEALKWAKAREKLERSLAAFVKEAWREVVEPGTDLIWNWHLDVLCAYLEALAERKITRLILNVPPGSMKSILVAVMYPAWVWAKRPTRKFLAIANEDGLASRDSLRMHQLVYSEWFQERWPLQADHRQNEKTLFMNKSKGFRQSIGINARVTGKRGDDLIIDDPLDATQAYSDVERVAVNDRYDQALSNRLNDTKNSAIVLIMQRLHQMDLTGHLLAKTETQWVHVKISMEYEGVKGYDPVKDLGREDLIDPREEFGELMFDERFGEQQAAQEKEDKGEYGWAGQYQQNPIPLGGGILKARWWRRWPKDKPAPEFDHIFYAWDTAFTEKDLKDNAYSTFLKWGVFWDETEDRYALFLLKRWHGQVGYPDLRSKAKREDKESKPHCHFIEKKASGQSLIQDLRRAGIKVRTVSPRDDKVARAHLESALLREGLVYAPERKWADEVISFIASFPNGAPPSADYTDTFTETLLYLRKGWWLEHPDDKEPLPLPKVPFQDDDFYEEEAPKRRPLAYGA